MLFLTLVAATSDIARALDGHDLEQYGDDEFCSQACNGACYGACYGLESQFDVILGLVGGGGGGDVCEDTADQCELGNEKKTTKACKDATVKDLCKVTCKQCERRLSESECFDTADQCELGNNKQTTKACKDSTVKDMCKVTCGACDTVESQPPTPAPPTEPVGAGGSCIEMCAGKCDEVCMGGEKGDGMDGMDGGDGMDGDDDDDDMYEDDDEEASCRDDTAASCEFANNKQANKACKDDTVKDTCKVTCKQCGRRLTSSLAQFI